MAKGAYLGDENSKAGKIKKIYLGDENSKAGKVKKAYIGDENGLARLCFMAGIPWHKHSCEYIPGGWVERETIPPTIWSFDGTFTQGGEHHHMTNFFESYRFAAGGTPSGGPYEGVTPVYIYAGQTAGVNKDDYVGLYLAPVSNDAYGYMRKITAITSFVDNGSYLLIEGECECVAYADYIETVYYKGDTAYGEVLAPEGELPDEGPLIAGSVDEGWCVLLVDQRYYYYELV